MKKVDLEAKETTGQHTTSSLFKDMGTATPIKKESTRNKQSKGVVDVHCGGLSEDCFSAATNVTQELKDIPRVLVESSIVCNGSGSELHISEDSPVSKVSKKILKKVVQKSSGSTATESGSPKKFKGPIRVPINNFICLENQLKNSTQKATKQREEELNAREEPTPIKTIPLKKTEGSLLPLKLSPMTTDNKRPLKQVKGLTASARAEVFSSHHNTFSKALMSLGINIQNPQTKENSKVNKLAHETDVQALPEKSEVSPSCKEKADKREEGHIWEQNTSSDYFPYTPSQVQKSKFKKIFRKLIDTEASGLNSVRQSATAVPSNETSKITTQESPVGKKGVGKRWGKISSQRGEICTLARVVEGKDNKCVSSRYAYSNNSPIPIVQTDRKQSVPEGTNTIKISRLNTEGGQASPSNRKYSNPVFVSNCIRSMLTIGNIGKDNNINEENKEMKMKYSSGGFPLNINNNGDNRLFNKSSRQPINRNPKQEQTLNDTLVKICSQTTENAKPNKYNMDDSTKLISSNMPIISSGKMMAMGIKARRMEMMDRMRVEEERIDFSSMERLDEEQPSLEEEVNLQEVLLGL